MELFKLFGTIAVENSEANKAIDETTDKAEESEGRMSSAFKKIGAIAAAAFATDKIISFGKDCLNAASEVEEMQNKFDVVFDGMTDQVEEWAANYADSIGRNSNTIKGYLADNQNMFVGMGMTRDSAADLSENLVSLAMDLASFNNLNEDDAVNAMSKALMGQTEAAKSLGAVLNENTRAMAMEQLGYEGKFDALSETEKMEVNYQAILMQSADAVGDCERSLDSYKGKTIQLNSAKEKLAETIGKALLPSMTSFIGKMVKVAEMGGKIFEVILPPLTMIIDSVLGVLFELIDSLLTPLMELSSILLNLAMSVLQPLIEVASMLITSVLQVLKPILEAFVEIIGAVLTPIIEALTPIFESIISALQPLFDLIVLLINYALKPVITVVTAVAKVFSGVLGGAIKIIMSYIQGVMGIFEGLIDFILGVFSGNWEKAWNGIVDVFKGIFNLIPSIVEGIINGAISIINGIIGGINKLTGTIGISAIPLIPDVKLPRLEEGGILEKGQVGLLEGNGAEAVVPLENNKKWISKVAADMQTQGIGGDQESMKALLDIMNKILAAIKGLNASEIIQVVPDEQGIFEIVKKQSRKNAALGKPGIVV